MRSRLFTWTTPFAVAAMLVVAVAIVLSTAELTRSRHPLVAPPTPVANWFESFPARIDRITAALQAVHLPVPLPAPQLEPQGGGSLRWTLRRYRLILPKPANPEHFDGLFDPIRDVVPGMVVHVVERQLGTEVMIGIDGLRTHSLNFEWLNRNPRVAVIIDNLGDDLLLAREFADLQASLTFGVLAARPFSSAVAERLRLGGREVLVNLHNEGVSSASEQAGKALLAQEEFVAAVEAALAVLPHATGVLPLQGSRLTTDKARMAWLFEALHRHHLYFVDATGTADAGHCQAAKEIGVGCIARAHTVDSGQDEEAAREALLRVLERSKVSGDQVVRLPATLTTLAALSAVLPAFAEQRVDIVTLSQLLPVTARVESHQGL